MAELDQSCCSPRTEATCCEPADKAECCGTQPGDGCGCGASTQDASGDIREIVREKYATYAVTAPGTALSPADSEGTFGAALYTGPESEVSVAAVEASLGCGVPPAVADLHDASCAKRPGCCGPEDDSRCPT
jgi:arsenite methyltransferase